MGFQLSLGQTEGASAAEVFTMREHHRSYLEQNIIDLNRQKSL